MNREYLPSRMFVIKVVAIIIIVAAIFGIFKLFKYFKNRPSSKTPAKVLIKDIVQKDSNNNGIADWEEYLWGLDPTKNGDTNKEFITAKKKTLAENSGITGNSSTTENDALAQDFLSIIISLKQSGTLNDDSINLIAQSVGDKVTATDIPDIYTKDMLTIKEDSVNNSIAYYNQFKSLSNKYANRNIGDELIFISEGMKNGDTTAMESTKTVAIAYKEFGDDLMKIPVPASIANRHLSLANNYEKTGQSVAGLSEIFANRILGMKSLLNYKKYSDALVSDIKYISDNL